MRRSIAAFCLLVPMVALAAPRGTVTTDAGALQGATDDGVISFKGVPFAAPPLGQLRWKPPQPVAKWSGVRQATHYGADCMQEPFPGDAAPLGVKPDEDCLYVNVWLPEKAAQPKLPVMVWIYGGGYVNGGGSPTVYDGSRFAKDGIVFVSFNYRLGNLGFFAHPALTAEQPSFPAANYGLMDQVAVLKWIQRNISAFGGDPHNVTIFGESAGGGSVNMLLTSSKAVGLFHKAAIESGGGRSRGFPARTLGGPNSAESVGLALAKQHGIEGQGADALAKLRAIPAEQLKLNMMTMRDSTYVGRPVVDGKLDIGAATTVYAAGKGARVPVMVGANSADIGSAPEKTVDELFASFGSDAAQARSVYNPDNSTDIRAVGGKVGADQGMIEPAREIARLLSARGQPVYEYRFSYVAESLRGKVPGALHATEIPYVFDTVSARYGKDTTPADEAAAKAMHEYWVAFVKTGKPEPAGEPAWPAYDAKTDQIMDFTTTGPVARPDPWKSRLDLAAASSDRREHSSPAPASDDRVEKLVRSLTLEEKISLISGTGFGTRPIPRLGIPAFKMSDGPVGVRSPGPSTAFAAGVALAATWDTALANEVGTQIGRDARSRGLQFVLGPGANLYRAPMNGRNFEYLGEDPWLASRLAVSYIEGVQSLNVSATIKHFVGNDSEYARHTSDSNIDERTLREMYLPTFEAAVKEAHVGSVMSSYNLINGEHATANPHIVRRILKGDWGFGGLYMSDWSATYDGVAAANAGLDLEMPSGRFMNAQTLVPAVRSGAVSESVIDDKVRRLLTLASRLGWLDSQAPDLSISRYNQAGKEVAHKGALESLVLLKNAANLLPLDVQNVRTIAVIGPNAHPAVVSGGGSAHITPFAPVSVLQGLSDKLGGAKTVTYARGLQSFRALALRTLFTTQRGSGANGVTVESFADKTFTGAARATRTERSFATGAEGFGGDPDLLTLYDSLPPERAAALLAPPAGTGGPSFDRWTGWYEATAAGAFTIFVQDTGGYRLLIDDEVVIDSSHIPKAIVRQTKRELSAGPHKVVLEQTAGPDVGRIFLRVGIVAPAELVDPVAKQLAARADAVVLAVGFDADIESEGGDREFGLPPGQDELIKEIAAVNPNTIVVINSGGAVEITPWIDSVKAVIQAWYPGQEGGVALADLLTGAANPSGRLPVSWERNLNEDPTFANYYYNDPMHPDRIVYREGVFVGYRGFEHAGVKPLYPFGFGLSYTSFKYSGFKVSPVAGGRDLYSVSFDVANTGTRAGVDVAQVYVGAKSSRVPRPLHELKAFARVDLRPGETKHVALALNARSFAYYDVKAARWQADAGEYRVELGRSSEDIQASESVKLPRELRVAVGD